MEQLDGNINGYNGGLIEGVGGETYINPNIPINYNNNNNNNNINNNFINNNNNNGNNNHNNNNNVDNNTNIARVSVRGARRADDYYVDWNKNEFIVSDIATDVYNQHAKLNFNRMISDMYINQTKPPIEYFKLLFPEEFVPTILTHTNNYIVTHKRGTAITKGRLYKYFGIRITMTLCATFGSYEEYFQDHHDSNSTIEHINFATKYGMSLAEFKKITECLRFSAHDDKAIDGDPLLPIEAFIEAFNHNRQQFVIPGHSIVVDECMSQWRGAESLVEIPGKTPHVQKITRKPEGVGFEFKACLCAILNVLIGIIMVRDNKTQKEIFEKDYPGVPPHTAVTLSLVEPWKGKNRIVIADAAFASLNTCTELLKKGFYFTGIVKTCTKGFPVKELDEWGKGNPNRGDWTVLTTNVKVHNNYKTVFALGWCAKAQMVKKFISSCSNTQEGDPLSVERYKFVENAIGKLELMKTERDTKRPVVLNNMYEHFGKIDLHDRFRQGYLHMEASWLTKRWWFRVFTTIFGFILTDSYMAYLYEYKCIHGNANNAIEFMKFLGFLSYSLINYDTTAPVATNLRKRQNDQVNEVNLYILYF